MVANLNIEVPMQMVLDNLCEQIAGQAQTIAVLKAQVAILQKQLAAMDGGESDGENAQSAA